MVLKLYNSIIKVLAVGVVSNESKCLQSTWLSSIFFRHETPPHPGKPCVSYFKQYSVHSNFFFTEAPKKTSGFRSTEQTVKISVQFCDFKSSGIQVYGLILQFSGSIRKNFGYGNGSFWKKKLYFLSFLSCLGLEPRIFGFKVNN
jgi:hypothetical protein